MKQAPTKPEQFTAYITKYALSKGVMELHVERTDSSSDLVTQVGVRFPIFAHVEGRDWHRTRVAAVARAEEMRIARLRSLDKQIKKLSALRFE